jgi:hypothetical protein
VRRVARLFRSRRNFLTAVTDAGLTAQGDDGWTETLHPEDRAPVLARWRAASRSKPRPARSADFVVAKGFAADLVVGQQGVVIFFCSQACHLREVPAKHCGSA